MTETLERRASEAPGNVRLIGGEMLLWSDTADVTGWRAAALELLDRLLPGAPRVLLVGPHPMELVDRVAGLAASATAVLRSFPDACALGGRHPGIDVHCGRLDQLDLDEPYDLVLALDGLARTHSAEAPALPWRRSLTALAGYVAPGGRLVLGVRNDLGVDRLLEARPPDGDGQAHGFDPTYPSGPVTLDLALESAGLGVERCYAAYPDGRAPRAMLARELLGMHLPEALTFPLSVRAGEPMLAADPLRLTRLVFRHRLGEELAPLWLAVAAHGDPAPADLPLGLVEEGAAVYELVGDGAGRLSKRLPCGEEQPVPSGRVVEEALVEACAREDVRAVRALLAALAEWVEDGGDVTATADTLVWDGETFHPLTPPPDFSHPTPSAPLGDAPSVVLCRMLWRFAVRLLAAGHHHPWPWPLESDQLTLTLCGLAGRPCDRAELELARELDAELGPGPDDVAPTYRDLLHARDRLTEQLAEALARISGLESRLRRRERALARARSRLRRSRHNATAYRRSLGYRLSRGLSGPRRAARKVMRMLYG